ncbi:MAG: Ig-like domain-containing protein [Polyangiaceae bacterium]
MRSRSLAYVSSLSSLLLLIACGDSESSPVSSSGGTSGSGGTAGSSGSSGSAGTGGTSGTGGTAGTAGSSGSSGSAGTGGTGGTSAHSIASISVYTDDFCNDCGVIQVGSSRQFHARALDADGNEITATFVWTMDDSAVATVDSTGLVTPVAQGDTMVNATAEGVVGSHPISITPASVFRVEVTPSSSTLASLGGTQAFVATAYDANDLPMTGVHFDWATGNPNIASIDSQGLATGVAQGATSVIAIANGWTTGWASLTVVKPIPDTTPFTLASLSGGGSHTCALDSAGKAWCWGWNFFGQIGNGQVLPTTASQSTPAAVSGDHSFVSITTGLYHSCAIDTEGAAWCWGDQDGGELGNGVSDPGPVSSPTKVLGDHKLTKIRAGGSHTCAIDDGKKLYCWGTSGDGALGFETSTPVSTPELVDSVHGWDDIATGLWSSCGLRDDHKVFCWGADDLGQLGDGEPASPSQTAVEVTTPEPLISIDMYRATVCGVTASGAVYCWGANDTGQIGESQTDRVYAPVKLTGVDGFSSVTAGSFHVCATTASDVYCRGDNSYGQLGDGTLGGSSTWVKVIGDLGLGMLDAGSHHTCSLTATGGTYCWGSNVSGVLGSGGSTDSDTGMSVVPWPVAQP